MKGVKVTVDRVSEVLQAISRLVAKDVLVGVPESETERKDDAPINNATLAYIHEYGSPAANIPARPFLIPGIANAQGKVLERFKQAATSALDGNAQRADRQLDMAGQEAADSVQLKINSGPFKELSERTLEERERRGVTRVNPLIDTGQLRNSITYVVRKKK